jgi:hypothetical protein
VYEGWVASAAGPVSTWRFTDSAAADSDGPGITGGPYQAPPFSGQDFHLRAKDAEVRLEAHLPHTAPGELIGTIHQNSV